MNLIEEQQPQGAIVPIQPKGSRPPFFCVHPGDGDVLCFYDLAKHLGPDQPFYGIQSLGWDGEVVPFTKSAEMAAHYVAEMRKIQPHGPYYLGGYLFGGKIAVYMANLLKEAGEEVALLAIISAISWAGRQRVPFGQWLERIGWPPGRGRITQWLERVGAPRGIGFAWLMARYSWMRLHTASVKLYTRGKLILLLTALGWCRTTGNRIPLFLCRPDVCNVSMHREHRHIPTYEGDAIYFRTEVDQISSQTEHEDAQESWGDIIKGNLDIISVTAGNRHKIMNEPYVKLFAQKLAMELARAQKMSNDAS